MNFIHFRIAEGELVDVEDWGGRCCHSEHQ